MKFFAPSIALILGLAICGDQQTVPTVQTVPFVDFGNGNQGIGLGNTLGGTNNLWLGNNNQIQGKENTLIGHQNDVQGKDNKVVGSDNIVQGNGNFVTNDSSNLQAAIQSSIQSAFSQPNPTPAPAPTPLPAKTSEITPIPVPKKQPNTVAGAFQNGNAGVGKDNQWAGSKNVWVGDRNSISGHKNAVVGDDNSITGKTNKVEGSGNSVEGIGNNVSGQGNVIQGAGNIVMSGGVDSPDIQLEIMKRFPAWMRDSATVPNTLNSGKSSGATVKDAINKSELSKQIDAQMEARFPAWMRTKPTNNIVTPDPKPIVNILPPAFPLFTPPIQTVQPIIPPTTSIFHNQITQSKPLIFEQPKPQIAPSRPIYQDPTTLQLTISDIPTPQPVTLPPIIRSKTPQKTTNVTPRPLQSVTSPFYNRYYLPDYNFQSNYGMNYGYGYPYGSNYGYGYQSNPYRPWSSYGGYSNSYWPPINPQPWSQAHLQPQPWTSPSQPTQSPWTSDNPYTRMNNNLRNRIRQQIDAQFSDFP